MKIIVDFKPRTAEAIRTVRGKLIPFLKDSGEYVREQAAANVAPGIGPGPHPHPGRVDTGDLMRDVQKSDVYDEGKNLVIEVGNTEKTYYGSILELGWHSRAGNFFRYPWLFPALESVRGKIMRRLRQARV